MTFANSILSLHFFLQKKKYAGTEMFVCGALLFANIFYLCESFLFMSLISNIYQTIYELRCFYVFWKLSSAGLMSSIHSIHTISSCLLFCSHRKKNVFFSLCLVFAWLLYLFSLFYSTWENRFSLFRSFSPFLVCCYFSYYIRIHYTCLYFDTSILLVFFRRTLSVSSTMLLMLSHLNQFQCKLTPKRTLKSWKMLNKKIGANRIMYFGLELYFLNHKTYTTKVISFFYVFYDNKSFDFLLGLQTKTIIVVFFFCCYT